VTSPPRRALWELEDDWAAAMRRRNLAAGTIELRIRLLRRWWTFTDGRPFGVGWRRLEAFLDAQPWSPRTRRDILSHLHELYRWAIRSGHTRIDPTLRLERPRLPPDLPRPLNDTDVALALTVASGHLRAALLLAATSGLRCCEIARLCWRDVEVDRVRVLGKGNRWRIVPLHPVARDALDDLERTAGTVFPWPGTPERPGLGASAALNGYLHAIGVDGTAHQLRHWCASAALAATGDLRAVQELLGHASPATTAIYTALDASRIAHVVDAIRLPVGDPGQPQLEL
jgi:integrase/recombinase XerD